MSVQYFAIWTTPLIQCEKLAIIQQIFSCTFLRTAANSVSNQILVGTVLHSQVQLKLTWMQVLFSFSSLAPSHVSEGRGGFGLVGLFEIKSSTVIHQSKIQMSLMLFKRQVKRLISGVHLEQYSKLLLLQLMVPLFKSIIFVAQIEDLV